MLATAYDSAVLFPVLLIAAALHCAGTNSPRCPLAGDVDGDGRTDLVLVERRSACSFALVVLTTTRRLHASIPEPFCRGKPSEFWPSSFPRVIALRPMNAQHGFEPEVLMWSGASNDGIRFFTVAYGRLRPMRIRPETFPKNEWNVGGFAAAFSETDCIRPHVVGRAGASYGLHRWYLFGELFRVTTTAFLRTELRARRAHTLAMKMWPHVRGDEFRHCGGVVRAYTPDP
jgi:hypothetical protein